ncbi:MAG: hypothetical protein EXS10_01320 [Phycisphaerales bacterium]|nr:hypothetical protein [Phycisphaerales bacterium]
MAAAAPTRWLDGHLDLAYLALEPASNRDMFAPIPADSTACITLPALSAARVGVALGTIFTELGGNTNDPCAYRAGDPESAHAAGVRQLEWYLDAQAKGKIRLVTTVVELDECWNNTDANAPLGVVLLMECADPIRNPEEVPWWFEQGVRVVGMAWGRGSRYCGGNAMAGGLHPIGRALVDVFDDLGMLHDTSHLSRAAFDDLLNATDRRIVATHSNAAALMPHSERHLTDVQLAAIASRDGVVGLNLFGKFLATGRPATLDDCVAHVERIAEFATSKRIALGSDFDGGFNRLDVPQEIGGPLGLDALSNALAKRGFSSAEVLGFQHENWLRVLRASLPKG